MKKALILATIALLGTMAGGCSKHHAHKKPGTKSRVPFEINLSGVTRDTVAKNGDVLTDTLKSYVKVSIADGATVTLKDLYIVGVNWAITPWAAITCEGDATIVLMGSNSIAPFHISYPGIFVPVGKTLTIRGEGSLDVHGRCSAAIGAGRAISCGNIVIEGGTITAVGCEYQYLYDTSSYYGVHADGGAGIGGAFKGDCGSITIRGGIINASGGAQCPGIGGGAYANCGQISISSNVDIVSKKGIGGTNSIGAGGNGTCAGVTIEDPSKVTQQ